VLLALSLSWLNVQASQQENQIFLNVSSVKSSLGTNVGWNILSNGVIIPAQNTVVTNGSRIAIFVNGGNGEAFAPIVPGFDLFGDPQDFMNFLTGLGVYNQIFGMTYTTKVLGEHGSAQFVAEQLKQLLPLKDVKIDIFAWSNGTAMTRYAMEAQELGKHHQFKNIVLAGPSNEGGLFGDPSTLTDPSLQTLRVVDSILVANSALVIGRFPTVQAYLTLQGSALGNPQLNTKFPGAGYQENSFFRDLNKIKVSHKVFENLRYYTVGGENVDTNLIIPVAFLNSVFPAPHPAPFSSATNVYQYLAMLGGISTTDSASLAIATSLQMTQPSIGLLEEYGISIAPANPKPATGDGIATNRNKILKSKSEFYKEHQHRAAFNVPANHFNLYNITDPKMRKFWTDLVNSFPKN